MKKLLRTIRNSVAVAPVLAFLAVYAPHKHAGRWVQFMPHWTANERLWAAAALALGLFAVLFVFGCVINVRKATAKKRPATSATRRPARQGY